jgi:hypothetical protein
MAESLWVKVSVPRPMVSTPQSVGVVLIPALTLVAASATGPAAAHTALTVNS